jgi:hypothetical protein
MPGTNNPSCKLTNDQVLEIVNTSGTLQSIADNYGIKMQSVHDIRTGRSWGWLTGLKGRARRNRRAGNDFR